MRASSWFATARRCSSPWITCPDDENERRRIDRGNPNLRKSLVTFTEGSWRVGGVLALSRAFGDAFLKESLVVSRALASATPTTVPGSG